MVKKYIPIQGDVVLLDSNHIKGHEQAGFRPVVVISNNDFISIITLLSTCIEE